jgi:carboxypeptidase C (cathepsin A)
VSAFNHYVRSELKFGQDKTFKPYIDIERVWQFGHQPPNQEVPLETSPDLTIDLAVAMKTNPCLKVMLNAGYFDLATPYYAALFEIDHLPIPPELRANVEVHLYESGHMVYANEASAKALHANVADFIRRASGEAR